MSDLVGPKIKWKRMFHVIKTFRRVQENSVKIQRDVRRNLLQRKSIASSSIEDVTKNASQSVRLLCIS